MPYRRGDILELCTRCGDSATHHCRRCGAPLCDDHDPSEVHHCASCEPIAKRNYEALIGLCCGVLGALSLLLVGLGLAGGLLGGALVAAAAPTYLAALRFGVVGLFSERWWAAAAGLGSLTAAAVFVGERFSGA